MSIEALTEQIDHKAKIIAEIDENIRYCRSKRGTFEEDVFAEGTINYFHDFYQLMRSSLCGELLSEEPGHEIPEIILNLAAKTKEEKANGTFGQGPPWYKFNSQLKEQ